MKKYDYLIVGSGLFGSVFACKARERGYQVLVVEKRNRIGGNVYTENMEGICVHKYGAHIFHTSNPFVWDFVNQYVPFRPFINSPVADYKGELYNLPFNMNTFYQLWGCKTPLEAQLKIRDQRQKYAHIVHPRNLEEQALALAGDDIYQTLIKGYSEKQWGMDARDIPAFVIKRLPFRFTFDNNYFDDLYQGIPAGGYTLLIEKMLQGIDVKLNCDFLIERDELRDLASTIVYTGPIDAYFNYSLGRLEYRSLYFEEKFLPDVDDFQGNAVFNFTDRDVAYTRIVEHKHFEKKESKGTVITYEYPKLCEKQDEPYYPINNERNNDLYEAYKELSLQEKNVVFGGRLAEYRYYDMDKVIERALNAFENVIR